MKRILWIMFLAALGAGVMSCGKEQLPPEEPAAGDEEYKLEVPEITSIVLSRTSIELDVEQHAEGKIVEVNSFNGLNPSVDLLLAVVKTLTFKVVEGSDVIDMQENERGVRILPKKVGKAKVKVSPSSGPASAEVSVVVSKGGVADATPLTSISATDGKTSFELQDLKGDANSVQIDYADVPLTLSPENAKVSDVFVYTDRELSYQVKSDLGSQGGLRIYVQSNSSNKSTSTGSFNLYVKPKKGTASPLVLTVKVYGHVYGVELQGIQDGGKEVETVDGRKTLMLTKGKSFSLKPKALKTGAVLEGVDKLEYMFSKGRDKVGNYLPAEDHVVDISDKGVVTPVKGMGEESLYWTVVSCPQAPFASPAAVPTYVFDKPESISVDKGFNSDYYCSGESVTIKASVLPSTARQALKYSWDDWYYSVTESPKNTFKLSFDKGRGKTDNVKFTLYSAYDSYCERVFEFKVYKYGPTAMPKPGDFVYYNSSTKTFRLSDGGFRTGEYEDSYSEWIKPSPKSGETLVGVVYSTESKFDNFPVNLAGINGKHMSVVSLDNGEECCWSKSNNATDFADKWKIGGTSGILAPYKHSTDPRDTYLYNSFWRVYYNGVTKDSYDVQPVIKVKSYADSHVIPVGTSSSAGTSGWLVMGYSDAAALYSQYRSVNVALGACRGVVDGWHYLSYSWTCHYDDVPNAFLFEYTKGPIVYPRDASFVLRPIFYL